MSPNRIFSLLIVVWALLVPGAQADAPRQLAWQDLLPELPTTENPFAKLTRDQRLMLSDIAAVRDRKARGDTTIPELELADEEFAARRLQQAGIDVDGLLAMRGQIVEQRQAQARAVNPALNGQVIRMPGYLLPLEFSGKKVSEFLLVPWVGACIHTPPPPPNQIVHVKADEPVEYDGLFKPVWVTGRMSAAAGKKSVFILDGSADVDVSYALQASRVEPYTQ